MYIKLGGTKNMVDFDFSKIIKSIGIWDRSLMRSSVNTALDAGVSPELILSEGLSKGMDLISKQFDEGSIYLPQVLAASNVMDEAMDMILDKLNAGGNRYKGVIVMGTVSGDIHQIGKNVCCAMLRGARYNLTSTEAPYKRAHAHAKVWPIGYRWDRNSIDSCSYWVSMNKLKMATEPS